VTGEAGRLDVRSVDERVMRTAGFLASSNAAYRGIVVGSMTARVSGSVTKSITIA
jgi:hypothetical protein